MQSVTKFCIGLWWIVSLIAPAMEAGVVFFTGEAWLTDFKYFWPVLAGWIYLGGVLFVLNQVAEDREEKKRVIRNDPASDKKD